MAHLGWSFALAGCLAAPGPWGTPLARPEGVHLASLSERLRPPLRTRADGARRPGEAEGQPAAPEERSTRPPRIVPPLREPPPPLPLEPLEDATAGVLI